MTISAGLFYDSCRCLLSSVYVLASRLCLCSPFTVRRFLEQMPPTPYPLHLPPPALSAHNVTISAPKTLGLSAPNLVLPLSPTPRTPIHSFIVVLEFVYLPPSLPPMSIRPPPYFVSSRNSLRCPSSSNSSSSCTPNSTLP